AHDAVLAAQRNGAVPRAARVAGIERGVLSMYRGPALTQNTAPRGPRGGRGGARLERALLAMYRDPALTEKPALLEQRGGAFYSEAAVGLVKSLSSGDGAIHEVDMRNGGTLVGLAEDDVVEVPARV